MHLEELVGSIKARRAMLQVNQEMLSELSGVSLRTIKEFESGKGNPTFQTISKLADVLGLELALRVKNLNSDR